MAHGGIAFKLILRIDFGNINCTAMGQVNDKKGIL
jgi:hypothetical protein